MAQLLENYVSFSKHNSKRKGNIIAGQFSKADVRNENGRIYRYRLWEHLLARPSFRDKLKTRRVLGQLGHPDIVETTLTDVSHIVTVLELRPDGTIYGEAEILDTPSGRILKTLYDAGVQLGISSRGYLPEGSNLIPEGNDLVVPDDFELVTFDFVIDPSSQDAFPSLQEGVVSNLKNILTESTKRINPDVVSFINNLSGRKPMNPNLGSQTPILEGNNNLPLSVKDRNKVNTEKEVPMMEAYKQYIENSLKVVEEMKNRYMAAEELIRELTARQHDGDAILNDISKRYLASEEIIEAFTEYAKKLESTLQEVSSQLQTANDVIADLAGRYTMSESVIKDLVAVNKQSEGIIASLRDSHTLAEGVIAELRDRLLKGKPVSAGSVTEDITKLQSQLALSESMLKEMGSMVQAAPVKRTPIPAGYFEGISEKYGVSLSEAKTIFKNCGRNKTAFEYHMAEKQRLLSSSSKKYSEFPYMLDESAAETEVIYKGNSEEAKIARLVSNLS